MTYTRRPRDSRRGKVANTAALLAVVSVTSGLFLVVGPRARSQIGAVRTEVGVDRQGWYWQRNQRVSIPGTGVQQELFPAPAQQHHLQVSLAGGEEDKRAYVGFDVLFQQGFIGGTVRSFTLGLEVSQPTNEHTAEHVQTAQESQTPPVPPSTLNEESANLVACPVTTFLADGADGDPMQDVEGTRIEPEFDCRQAMVQGRRSADGASWMFDLTQIANLWASGDTPDAAVVIKPAADAPQPPAPESTWVIGFHGRQLEGLAATMTYTPVGEDLLLPPPVPPPSGPGTTTTVEELGTTPETVVSREAPEPEIEAPAAAPPLGRPQPRYPWYAFVPWIAGAAALVLAYYALRESPGGAARHNVADLLRRRRLAGAPA